MPPKRSASATAVKAESPSRRKVGRPKKFESEAEGADLEDAAPEEIAEADSTNPSPKRRGKRKSKTTLVDEIETAEEEDATVTTAEVVTLNMEDLIDLPGEALPPSPAKKRKAPAKTAATKKSKSDTSVVKDMGGAGDMENLIQCSLCDAKVVQLVRHIRAQHGDDPDYDSKIKEARTLEAKVQSTATPKKTTSNLLDDLTITVGKMERTAVVDRRTTGERGNSLVRPKNTQCPICEKVVRRYDLNKHIRNVHSGEKPNKCPYCEYASPWKGNLNTHIAGVHTKARLHDCIRCGLSFKTRSAMIGHVRKVHDKMYQPKERLFECEECNKKFYKKFHLQRHIRVHTGEKPFTCAFCEKMFASKTNMDSHIQSVHLKIKPFKCGYCEKGFARKKMMLLHIRKFHMNKDDANLLGMSSLDDITLDDNLDNESEGSVESGELLAGEDGLPDSGMVLVKMRGDDLSSEGVKQYMFVPSDDLPSDLDNTLDNTGDASLLSPDSSLLEPKKSGDISITKMSTKNQPVVINVGAGQVVQAVQTKDGIMLVTQPATQSNIKAVTKAAAAKTLVTAKPIAASAVVAEAPKDVEEPVEEPAEEPVTEPVEEPIEEPLDDAVTATVADPVEEPVTEPAAEAAMEETEAVTENDNEPAEVPAEAVSEEAPAEEVVEKVTEVTEERDLVQQALAESVPEAVGAKSAILNTETELMGGLPANLLATEEGDQTEANTGEKTVETFFLTDIQTNGSG